MKLAVPALLSCALLASACAPKFSASMAGENGFYIRYNGSSFDSTESIQIEWLYNTATLVLDQGYDGFALEFSSSIGVSDRAPRASIGAIGAGSFAAGAVGGVLLAVLPGAGGGRVLQENILMLKKPFVENGVSVFDAARLKGALEPCIVNAKAMDEACRMPLDYIRRNATNAQP